MYYLFLDDFRDVDFIKEKYPLLNKYQWIIAKSFKGFRETVLRNGLPEFVSFDHDLADEHYEYAYANAIPYSKFKQLTGLECALWLVGFCCGKGLELPKWEVHSFNKQGKENIISVLKHLTV
ncbi:MAG: cyclic-phosphate processing receiver domain-containing protein [Nanoarchaeota archaeon]